MSPIRVRISQPNELEQLDALYRVWGYQGGVGPADMVYIAEEGKRPVGLVRRALEEGKVMLRGMRVDPAYQRRGVGSRLLDAFVADLSHAECFCIPYRHLTSFYHRGGFVVVGESEAPMFLVQRVQRYQHEGRDVVIMRR